MNNRITKAIENDNIEMLSSLDFQDKDITEKHILNAVGKVSAKYIKLLFNRGLTIDTVKKYTYSVVFDTHLKPIKFLFEQGLTVDDIRPCLPAVPSKEILEFFIEKGISVKDIKKSGLLYEAYEFKFYDLVEYIHSLGDFQRECVC